MPLDIYTHTHVCVYTYTYRYTYIILRGYTHIPHSHSPHPSSSFLCQDLHFIGLSLQVEPMEVSRNTASVLQVKSAAG